MVKMYNNAKTFPNPMQAKIRVELIYAWDLPGYPQINGGQWYDQVREWCEETFGCFLYDTDLRNRFIFYNEQDLTMFMLRWGNYVIDVVRFDVGQETQSPITRTGECCHDLN